MKLHPAAVAALLLAACGQEQPAPTASPSASSSGAAAAPIDIPVAGSERRILALGDSLFAGYGLASGDAYPVRLEAAMRAKGINARVVNASVSGDTSGDGLRRLAFILDSQPQPPEMVLISLGGNDMLRGLPPEQTRQNLDAILTELRRRNIKPLLMGMLAPPNLGPEYRRQFDAIYPALANKHGAGLVPFFLQAVIGKPGLVQADHIHPTLPGIESIVAATTDSVAAALPRPT